MRRVLLHQVSRSLLAALLLGMLLIFPFAPTVHAAATQWVSAYTDDAGGATNCTDVNTRCTLRDALNAAADGDTIQFAFFQATPVTYTLANGTLTVRHAVTIQGPGADKLTISGGGAVTAFTVSSGVTATISGLTIANGHATNGSGVYNAGTLTVTGSTIAGGTGGNGGGIYNTGTLAVIGSTIADNLVTGRGGGIANPQGRLTVTDSTFSGNAATDGGGIDNGNGTTASTSTLTVTRSTFVGNITSGGGGGINSSSPFSLSLMVATSTFFGNRATHGGGIIAESMTVADSTFVGNSAQATGGGLWSMHDTSVRGTLLASPTGGNCVGAAVVSQDYNLASDTSCRGLTGAHDLVGVDPGLDPAGLQANGSTGPQTIVLLPNSVAIEAGISCSFAPGTDERGQPRVGNCDIGAYEYQPFTPTVQSAAAPVVGGSITFRGTGFQTGTQIVIAGTSHTALAREVSPDGMAITTTVPAHSAGAVALTLTNPGSGHVVQGTLVYAVLSSPLPRTQAGGGSGPPVTLPGSRSAGSLPAAGSPNPLPMGR